MQGYALECTNKFVRNLSTFLVKSSMGLIPHPSMRSTRPRSAVGNVSGYRYVSDCKLDSARSHTFVEIDNEIISAVILLPSADSLKKGCCQLQANVRAQATG